MVVDIVTPVGWKRQAFFASRGHRVFGFVAAFSPTCFAVGAELITGESKGAAIMLGPFWLGFATLRAEPSS